MESPHQGPQPARRAPLRELFGAGNGVERILAALRAEIAHERAGADLGTPA